MKIQRFAVVLFVFLAICFCAFGEATAEVECSHPSMQEGLDAMESNAAVLVTTVQVDSWPPAVTPAENDNLYFTFEPKDKVPTSGLIIHPGGNSDPRGYAPMAQAIASEGYFVGIIPMPGCISIGGYDRTAKVIADFGEIKTWTLVGHSVGGASVSQYVYEYGGIDGLVMLAGLGHSRYHLDNTHNVKVLSLYGENDTRLTPEMIMENADALPDDTIYVEIKGGNHSQFAWLDPTPELYYFEGDSPATITHQEQQDIVVQYILEFIESFGDNAGCPAVSLLGEKSQQLVNLRRFRDEILAKSTAGQKLIDYYYLNSDTIIEIIDKHPTIRESAKKVLELLIPVMDKLLF